MFFYLKVRSAGSRTKTANTCQTVGHFYRPWGSIVESESDREIRRTLEKYETNKKHETNNFSKNFFLHIFSADREKISRDLVEILSKSLTHCVKDLLRNSTKSRNIFFSIGRKNMKKKSFLKNYFLHINFCKCAKLSKNTVFRLKSSINYVEIGGG